MLHCSCEDGMETARASMLKIVRLTPAMLREELVAYELKHGIPSAEFYDRYCAGECPELPHAEDFFRWAGLWYTAMSEPELQDLFEHQERHVLFACCAASAGVQPGEPIPLVTEVEDLNGAVGWVARNPTSRIATAR